MNKQQKEVLKAQLSDEEKILKWLNQVYTQASKDCADKIRELSSRTDMENLQSIIYQKQYQEALKNQIDGILNQLQSDSFLGISDYMQKCYKSGYVGAMYDINGQGIPIIMPIDQKQVVQALENDTKLSQGLYNRLGEDTTYLNKKIKAELSRGIVEGKSWNEIANRIADGMTSPFKKAKNNAMRIARTEGHRVQLQGQMNACEKAKSKGADVVKQWDSTLDGRTRDSHRVVDGEIRELDEKFSNGLRFPSDPHGRASEVVNCRCALLQRARWGLDADELKTLQDRASFFGLDKSENFEDFRKKYLKITEEDIQEADVNSIVNSFINKLNEHAPVKFSDLNTVFKQEIQDVFDNAPQNIRRINQKYIDFITFINEKVVGTAHTNSIGISVNLRKDSNNPKGKWTTLFHEIGHKIDITSGNITTKTPEFKKWLQKDFETVLNAYKRVYNVNTEEAYSLISDRLFDEPKLHSISDLIGGITNNKCKGEYYHSDEYWKKPYRLEMEAFAHFYEATARNDSEKLDAIKEMFPNAYAEFERMVKKI